MHIIQCYSPLWQPSLGTEIELRGGFVWITRTLTSRTAMKMLLIPHDYIVKSSLMAIKHCLGIVVWVYEVAMMQYNTIQYNTIQYNTIQYNTIQYDTILYNTIYFSSMYLCSVCLFAGQLTDIGGNQHHILGGQLRSRYIDRFGFLQSELDPNEVWCRSTNVYRTIQSAQV